MSDKILVPILGESITEATVAKWLKKIGDEVFQDESLVELETDKVNVEVPSPSQGTLSQIKAKAGDTVEVGSLLGIIGEKNSIERNIKKGTKDPAPKQVKQNKKKVKKNDNQKTLMLVQDLPSENLELNDDISDEKPLVLHEVIDEKSDQKTTLSPAVRKIVKEKKIDITNLSGSGKDGRIIKEDLLNLMGNVPEISERKKTHGPEERVKMTRLRLTIARRLKEAQENAAMLTTFNEVDMQNVIKMRQDYKKDFEKRYSTKLGFMSFFVKSSVVALKNFPAINAEIDSDHIVYKNYYNISIAVGTDKGLVVPVLKNADELSFADIETNISSLSEKAKKGKITIEDLQGGTFTITNGGIYGSMLSTPILNPPQSGVLGMHNIIERPVVINGNVEARPIMYLALSYDHRIVDGKDAVSFLKCIKDCLEEPRRLFLDL